ncbi:procollagen C-endopeptidase enhancer 1-like [Dreissena polymorpha]|uniref:procollagen C-endopeptidase enhancer 1-like n=1 Tax=Dreissena polymorpha TaxID=45954 RepID=UPI002263B33E|nr:procollagen C-endopeptidase enhancer 1-like [Dreissena polymorpha]
MNAKRSEPTVCSPTQHTVKNYAARLHSDFWAFRPGYLIGNTAIYFISSGGGSGITGASAAVKFTCPDGSCIDMRWLCDGDDDCGDGTGEKVTTCRTNSTAACGNTNLTGTEGTIKSPNYPSKYPNDITCIYHIIADASTTRIYFKFDNIFDVEDDPTCQYDYIKITTDGVNANKHGPLCGTTAPTPFNVPGNQAVVVLMADSSTVSKGFRVDLEAHGN